MAAQLDSEIPLVAYLGPEGTFTHLAARTFADHARLLPMPTVYAVFAAVRGGVVDRGVVPAENSTEGAVTATTDALIEGDVFVCAEVVLKIEHSLLARPGTDLRAVRRVHSHPQALAQCRAFLERELPEAELVAAASTAAAAIAAAATPDPVTAALGSAEAGALYGLTPLRERVQDLDVNATRFFVLGPKEALPAPSGDDKTTIGFALRHVPGALRRALTILEDSGVNLVRIESRPSSERTWEYVFLVDVEGHASDPEVSRALEQLATVCEYKKLLGSYRRAR